MDRFIISPKLNNLKKEYSEIQEFLQEIRPETASKINKILNESQIQQIELEIQNDELRSIQIELQNLKNEYFELYNNAPVGYLVLNSNAVVVKCNICFQNYLGLTASEILHKPLNNFIGKNDQNDFLAIFTSFFKNPKNKIFDYEFVKSDSSIFNGRMIGSKLNNSIFDPDSDDRILVVISDISVQKFYEKKMEELVANKTKFISTIAHDIRNPLNSILGYSEFLLAEFNSLNNAEFEQYLMNLNSSGKNLYKLIDNLLNLSKINFSSENIKLSNVDQNKIISEILIQISDNVSDKNIEIDFNPKNDFFCLCDTFMISSVYRNILTNAVKFSNPNGKITIETMFEKKQGIIKIRDYGIGISEEHLDELFSPKKIRTTFGTKNEKGSGIGLLITKEYLDKMSGEIFVKSNVDKGTEFTIKLLTN